MPPPSSDSFIIDFGQVFVLPGVLSNRCSTMQRGSSGSTSEWLHGLCQMAAM